MSIFSDAEFASLNVNLKRRLVDLKKNSQGILEILSTIVKNDHREASPDIAYYIQDRPSEEIQWIQNSLSFQCFHKVMNRKRIPPLYTSRGVRSTRQLRTDEPVMILLLPASRFSII